MSARCVSAIRALARSSVDHTRRRRMHTRIRAAGMVAAIALAGLTIAYAQNGTPLNPNTNNALTLAVYGDSPYGLNPTDAAQTDKTAGFIASINADPKVDLVL